MPEVLTLELLIGNISRVPLRILVNDQPVHTVEKPLPRTESVEQETGKRFVKNQERVSVKFGKPAGEIKSLPLAIRFVEDENYVDLQGEIDVLADGLWCNIKQAENNDIVLQQRHDDKFDSESDSKTVQLESLKKKQQEKASKATTAADSSTTANSSHIQDGDAQALRDTFRPEIATAEGRSVETAYIYLGNIAASRENPCEIYINGELAISLEESCSADALSRFVVAVPKIPTDVQGDDTPHIIIDVSVKIQELGASFDKRFDLTANGSHILLGVVPDEMKVRIQQKSQPNFPPLRVAATTGNPLMREVKVYLRGVPASEELPFTMRIQNQEVARLSKPIGERQIAVVATQVIPTNGNVIITLIIPQVGFTEEDPIVEEFDIVGAGAFVMFDCSEGELKIKQEHHAFDTNAL